MTRRAVPGLGRPDKALRRHRRRGLLRLLRDRWAGGTRDGGPRVVSGARRRRERLTERGGGVGSPRVVDLE